MMGKIRMLFPIIGGNLLHNGQCRDEMGTTYSTMIHRLRKEICSRAESVRIPPVNYGVDRYPPASLRATASLCTWRRSMMHAHINLDA